MPDLLDEINVENKIAYEKWVDMGDGTHARQVFAGAGGGSSGGSVPAIIRGSYDLSRYPGVVEGVVDSTQRTANGVALQAGLDYCATNKLWAELPPGRFEYDISATQNTINVGLRANKDLLGLIGGGMHSETNGTRLIQYAVNQAALTIGDCSATQTDNMSGADFRDFCVGYGTSQTGQTQARALIWSGMKDCSIRSIKVWPWIAGGGAIHPYIGLAIGPVSNRYFYDNEVENIKICGGQANFVKIDGNGTGNRWGSMHLGTGDFGSLITLSAPAMDVNTANLPFGSIAQLNIEWVQSTQPFLQNRASEFNIGHLHLEGCKLTGTSESMVHVVNAALNIGTMQMRNVALKAADITTAAAVFSHFGVSDVKVNGRLEFLWSGSGTHADAVADRTFQLFLDTTAAGNRPSLRVNHIRLSGDTGAFNLDSTTTGAAPTAAGGLNNIQEYVYHKARSRTDGAEINMANADLTVYGQHRNAKVTASVTLTANRTLTINDKLAATGAGAASARSPGDLIIVSRTAGGAFDLIVNNHTGTPAYTFVGVGSQNTEKVFEWNGTALVAL